VRIGRSNPVRFKGVSRSEVVVPTGVGAMKGETVENGGRPTGLWEKLARWY